MSLFQKLKLSYRRGLKGHLSITFPRRSTHVNAILKKFANKETFAHLCFQISSTGHVEQESSWITFKKSKSRF